MAGDWLKFDKATLDKPEVFAIAAKLDLDPDAVVGKLMRLWSWFDSHTTDGNARGVTLALLDRITCVTGFAIAVTEQGWLVMKDGTASLPNFDRHNGETAKSRALTAQRVAKHKGKRSDADSGNVKGNAACVTDPLPREEKRREEKGREENTSAPQAVAGEGLALEVETVGGKLRDDYPPDFIAFWEAYPRKKSKGDAWKAWQKHKCKALLPQILLAIQTQRESHDWTKDGGQFIPYPASWLNDRAWEDEVSGSRLASTAEYDFSQNTNPDRVDFMEEIRAGFAQRRREAVMNREVAPETDEERGWLDAD